MLRYSRSIVIAAPIERVFAFHLDTQNAARIAPPFPRVTVLDATTPPTAGTTVQKLRIGLGIVSVSWEALVTKIEAPTLVEDIQQRGPYAHWLHRHRFAWIDSTHTKLTDEVECAFPWYLGGVLADYTAVWLQLTLMFGGRHLATKRLLEDPEEPIWMTASVDVDQAAARKLGVDSTGGTRQTGMFPSITLPPPQ